MWTRIAILTLVSLAVGVLAFEAGSMLRPQTPEPPWKPFTAVLVEKRYWDNGKMRTDDWPDIEYRTFARRSDGSEVRLFRRLDPDGNRVERREIRNLASQTVVSVEPTTQSKSTRHLSGTSSHSHPPTAEACGSHPGAERGTLLGYQVVRMEGPLPGLPQSHDEIWLAPGLDCFVLRERYTFAGDDWTVRDVLFVIEGEPAPSLFSVPASYPERSPSQVFVEYERRFPAHRIVSDEMAELLDRAYHAAQ